MKKSSKPCFKGDNCPRPDCPFVHPKDGQSQGPSGDHQGVDLSTKQQCLDWMNNQFCFRINCRDAHVIPGTQDLASNTYIVINKEKQLRL